MNRELNSGLKEQAPVAMQWNYWMSDGQDKVTRQDWEAAAVCYKKAFELAEQLVCSQCHNLECSQQSLQRYLASANEYATAIHRNNYHCALAALMNALVMRQSEALDSEQEAFARLLKKIECFIYAV